MNFSSLRQALARRHEKHLRRAASIKAPEHDDRHLRRLRVYVLWFLIATTCAFLDYTGGWGFGWLEGYFYNSATATRADLRSPGKAADVIIVAVNDDSFAVDNPINIPGPPPPRMHQAQLLRFLTDAGVKAVAFDFL